MSNACMPGAAGSRMETAAARIVTTVKAVYLVSINCYYCLSSDYIRSKDYHFGNKYF